MSVNRAENDIYQGVVGDIVIRKNLEAKQANTLHQWSGMWREIWRKIPKTEALNVRGFLLETYTPKTRYSLNPDRSHYALVMAQTNRQNQVLRAKLLFPSFKSVSRLLDENAITLDKTGALTQFTLEKNTTTFNPACLRDEGAFPVIRSDMSPKIPGIGSLPTSDWRANLQPGIAQAGPKLIFAYALPDPESFPTLKQMAGKNQFFDRAVGALDLMQRISSTTQLLLNGASEWRYPPGRLYPKLGIVPTTHIRFEYPDPYPETD